MAWLDQPESDAALAGMRPQACAVNVATRAQALHEWMYVPDTIPPFLTPPILEPRSYAISTELLADYDVRHAQHSRRRADAEAGMMRMVEEQAPTEEMRWIVTRGRA
jgi:hypothetical protein